MHTFYSFVEKCFGIRVVVRDLFRILCKRNFFAHCKKNRLCAQKIPKKHCATFKNRQSQCGSGTYRPPAGRCRRPHWRILPQSSWQVQQRENHTLNEPGMLIVGNFISIKKPTGIRGENIHRELNCIVCVSHGQSDSFAIGMFDERRGQFYGFLLCSVEEK